MIDVKSIIAQVDETGISAKDYREVLSILSNWFKQIYGEDIYITPDSKDGQWLAIIAMAIHESNNTHIATYRSFSPSTATGEALSSNVKINGISRNQPTNSQTDLLLIGQVGTVISNASVRDSVGNLWNVPDTVISTSGQITVTATCSISGSITALPNTITEIATPTRGWQSVTNPNQATVGQPVETDSQLRIRQKLSTALPSRTILSGILGAISTISGVTRFRGYDNDTHQTDSNGISPHSICLVVEGGDGQTIANTIAVKKSFGGTYGDQIYQYTDEFGTPYTIRFFRPTVKQVYVKVTIKALTGYTTSTGDALKSAISNYINEIKIGEPVRISKLYIPANLACSDSGNVYDIQELLIGNNTDNLQASNINIDFNAVAECSIDNIQLVVE